MRRALARHDSFRAPSAAIAAVTGQALSNAAPRARAAARAGRRTRTKGQAGH